MSDARHGLRPQANRQALLERQVVRAKAKAIPREDRRDVALSAVFVTFAFILSALLGPLLS